MKTAILIPCYNEAKTIEKVVKDFKRIMPHAEIYVYDNNSTDGTDDIARKAGAIVRYEYKQGKGNVIRTMFREIKADCYILVDGDDTYPAESSLEFEKLIHEGKADMVIGDRLSTTYFNENSRLFHNTGNKMVRKFINVFFKSDLKDIMTGMRAFSYDFVKSFPISSKEFEIETEMSVFVLFSDFTDLADNCRNLLLPDSVQVFQFGSGIEDSYIDCYCNCGDSSHYNIFQRSIIACA